MLRITRRTSLAFALMLGAMSPVFAQSATPIRMIGFGGATNLPAWVALDKGFFAKEGLAVTLDKTNGSKDQMQDVMSGKYEFVTTAFDNIVAYTDGQGAVKFDNFDLKAILGVHSGLNSVVARPEIKKYEDLRGKTVAVDAVSSGYATVLYEILKRKGLTDKDYKVIAVGATDGRMAALEDGRAQVGILSSPQDIQLQKKGFTILDDAAAALGELARVGLCGARELGEGPREGSVGAGARRGGGAELRLRQQGRRHRGADEAHAGPRQIRR